MKKKIFSLLICFLMCLTVLAGCDPWSTDMEAYYNTVVASINFEYTIARTNKEYKYTVDITKRDLLNAYSSYGNYYTQYGDGGVSGAIEQTLDTVINRRFIQAEVERYCLEENLPLITDNEKTYLWQQTYTSIYNNLKNYYLEVLDVEETEDETTTDENTPLYTEYKPSGYYKTEENGRTVVRRYNAAKYAANVEVMYSGTKPYDYEAESGEFKDLIYNKITALFSSGVSGNKKSAWETAFNKYMNAIRNNYSYENLKDSKKCFYFEMDRIYGIVKDNFLVEKYEQINDLMAQDGSVLTNITPYSIVDNYATTVRTGYSKYNGDVETTNTDMLSASTKVDYVFDNGVSYFNLGVIKINYNGSKADIEAAYEQDHDYEAYQEALQSLYNTKLTARDEYGNVVDGEEYTAEELRALIEQNTRSGEYLDFETVVNDNEWLSEYFGTTIETLTDAQRLQVREYVERTNLQVAYNKADEFVKYLYQYNDNYANVKADKTSVFGIDGAGNVGYSEDFADSECDALSDAIRNLYADGQAKVGKLSEVVEGEDGYYILFYAGKVENLFTGITKNFQLTEKDLAKLGYTRVDIFSKQTYFDKIYSDLYAGSSFDAYDEARMNSIKSRLTKEGNEEAIQIYVDRYADLMQ